MGVIDHYRGIIFFSKINHLGSFYYVTLHRKDPVGHYQLEALRRTLAEPFLQAVHVIVPIFQNLRKGEPAAFNDGGVIKFVKKDIVTPAGKRRHNPRLTWKPVL